MMFCSSLYCCCCWFLHVGRENSPRVDCAVGKVRGHLYALDSLEVQGLSPRLLLGLERGALWTTARSGFRSSNSSSSVRRSPETANLVNGTDERALDGAKARGLLLLAKQSHLVESAGRKVDR